MYSFQALISNYCLICVGVAWIMAQIIKVFTGYFSSDEKFSLTKFFCGTGGMPSSHTSTVIGLATAIARQTRMLISRFVERFISFPPLHRFGKRRKDLPQN